MSVTKNVISIGPFTVRNTSSKALIRLLVCRLRSQLGTIVCFANANFVMQCRSLARDLSADPSTFILNDGVAMSAAARLRHGRSFRENLNGTDFTPALLAKVPLGTRIYLLGAQPQSVAGAAVVLSQYPNLTIVGVQDGYSMWEDEKAVDRIHAAAPDVLLVALGNPIQEEWILTNRASLSVPLILGVGALFDFLSGRQPRAPTIVRKLRLEWAFRLAREPWRLARRYTIDMARFFAVVLLSRQR